MYNEFDEPPVYDILTKDNVEMGDVWQYWFATFILTLKQYLTPQGIVLPPLTTAERDALPTPRDGTMIFNTTANTPQVWHTAMWNNF